MLILAGISIAMLTGDNGILTKADKATEEHSHASVREGIILAYNEYQTELQTLAEETQMKEDVKLASTEVTKIAELNITKNTSFIEFLQGKDYIDANGIVNTQELLGSKTKLGNGDGTEYRDVYIVSSDEENNRYVLTYHYTRNEKKELWEVATSGNAVKINVSKTPETEMAGVVKLKVTSVEGIEPTTISVDEMEEEELKELIMQIEIIACNKWEGTEFTNFDEVLQHYASEDYGWLDEPTEEAFWIEVRNSNDGSLKQWAIDLVRDVFADEETEEIKTYYIVNPEGEISDTYIATENGKYTFTVKDLFTGETYEKTVNVDNIDDNMRRQLTIIDQNVGSGNITIYYQEGMTWQDWINSTYNDPESDFYIGEDSIEGKFIRGVDLRNRSVRFDLYDDLGDEFRSISVDEEIDPTRIFRIYIPI